jgi:GH15 family glucan-1,4-alpha-glucosidase
MPSRIEEYAFLSDTESAALVSRDGSIDWLTLPRFDSPACFAALLGTEEHGRWRIAPTEPPNAVHRQYLPGTLVLETEYLTDTGTVVVYDFMAHRDERPNLFRIIEGREGSVPMSIDLRIRFDYGSVIPWVRRRHGSVCAVSGPEAVCIHTPAELEGHGLSHRAELVIEAGDRVPFELLWYPSHREPDPPLDPDTALAFTMGAWEGWAQRCTYTGEYAHEIRESLNVLKGLTYRPTGGIVAAATTSLPEQLGGERNWDYRYCWLRDTTFTLLALLAAGYTEEAAAWRDWLLRAVAGDPSKLQIMYGPAGERRLTEMELDWLPGYEGSTPVRIGNAASEQFQLDVYGEVLDALYQSRRAGLPPDDHVWRLERLLVEYVADAWKEPDEGIWEIRGPRQHFTHSKIMAWVAVDRAIRSVEEFDQQGPVERWRSLRDEIRADVLANGVDPERQVLVQHYGTAELDASLLMAALVGFLAPDDPLVANTVAAIEQELMSPEGYVSRYRPQEEGVDGLAGTEGSFLLCTFWLADNYALMGRQDEARALFERLLDLRNDVGLLSEQVEPTSGRLLGNIPQAFSHIALINTAMNLDKATSGAGSVRSS